MIHLTWWKRDDPRVPVDLSVKPERVESVRSHESGAQIVTFSGTVWVVKESREEVLKLLEKG